MALAKQESSFILHSSSFIRYPILMTRQVVIATVVGVLGAVMTLASVADGLQLTNPALLLGVLLLADAVLRFMMLPRAGS
jgi:hypothetical protein